MARLNQIVALVSGKKSAATAVLTEAYHKIQKATLFDGVVRTYRPKDEDGEQLPAETKLLQAGVGGLIADVQKALVASWDCVATQDVANTLAKVPILDEAIMVPVTYLLFLEKQLTDVATFISKLPVLDPSEDWKYDPASDCYRSVSETTRTKKVPKAFVAYEATKEHPAQVQIFNEDVLVGYWKTTKQSGALPLAKRNDMLARCQKLKDEIVKAREEANCLEVVDVKIAEALLKQIFQGE